MLIMTSDIDERENRTNKKTIKNHNLEKYSSDYNSEDSTLNSDDMKQNESEGGAIEVVLLHGGEAFLVSQAFASTFQVEVDST
eukprot:UN04855